MRKRQPKLARLELQILEALWALGKASIREIQESFPEPRPAYITIQTTVYPLRSTPGVMEPGVVGLWRPVILVPSGIEDDLTSRQLAAVLTHELCHIRRRDNTTAAVHMIAEAVFWFHLLVWWIGARLLDERERACDQEVLRIAPESDQRRAGSLRQRGQHSARTSRRRTRSRQRVSTECYRALMSHACVLRSTSITATIASMSTRQSARRTSSART